MFIVRQIRMGFSLNITVHFLQQSHRFVTHTCTIYIQFLTRKDYFLFVGILGLLMFKIKNPRLFYLPIFLWRLLFN